MRHRLHEQKGKDYFATTRWTVVLAAADKNAGADNALAELCQLYWVPLYTFLRKNGHQPAEAEDIVQSFLARLIEKSALSAADPRRGRFRSFLISSLQHFVANRRDHDQAAKRGGHRRTFNLDFNAAEAACHREPWTGLTPEKIFDRRWALDLLNLVLARLQREYADGGKSELFKKLSPSLTGGAEIAAYADIAEELHTSSDAVKMAASRLRKRYREILRQFIADTVTSQDEVDDEIRHLFQALSS
jgi:DNA-directed RNA polymerase specialized sigma24 family protein